MPSLEDGRMESVIEQIKYILSPKSVAIVGASSDFSKFTGRTLKYLLKHGYKGRIYPINPKYREMAGNLITRKGLEDYLVLLSIQQTCKYRGIGFLDFLKSGNTILDV